MEGNSCTQNYSPPVGVLLPYRQLQPRIRITEQPAERLRFRYACEHRSYIRGAGSTRDLETYPTVEILDYHGLVQLTVYSVTEDSTPLLHPHKLLGTCDVIIGPKTPLIHTFKDLSILCTTRKALKYLRVENLDSVNLNVVRLCFQANLLTDSGQVMQRLTALSTKIYNEKKRPKLIIHQLSDSSSPAKGGRKVILLCDEVDSNDIKVRFSLHQRNQPETWSSYGIFRPDSDVHKKVAICFRTPPFQDQFIKQSVTVRIQLERPSDGSMGEAHKFEYNPNGNEFRLKRKSRSKCNATATSSTCTLPAFEEIRKRKPTLSVVPRVEPSPTPTSDKADSITTRAMSKHTEDDASPLQCLFQDNLDWFNL